MFELHPQLAKDCFQVCDLTLSRVLLMNDRQHPWLIQVPMLENSKEVIDLNSKQQQTLWIESALIDECLKACFSPDKLNVAALGNMVPQLHIHHIARYVNDPAWPKPVWGVNPAVPYENGQAEELIEKLKPLLKQ